MLTRCALVLCLAACSDTRLVGTWSHGGDVLTFEASGKYTRTSPWPFAGPGPTRIGTFRADGRRLSFDDDSGAPYVVLDERILFFNAMHETAPNVFVGDTNLVVTLRDDGTCSTEASGYWKKDCRCDVTPLEDDPSIDDVFVSCDGSVSGFWRRGDVGSRSPPALRVP